MSTTRFGAQELGTGAISPKMVEPQLEGDKVAYLGLGNLVAAPVLENKLFLQLFLLPFSLGVDVVARQESWVDSSWGPMSNCWYPGRECTTKSVHTNTVIYPGSGPS